MLATRRLVVAQRVAARSLAPKAMAARGLSTPAPKKEEQVTVNPVTEKLKKMRKENMWTIKDVKGHIPAPALPEDPKELTYVDPADMYNPAARQRLDGSPRTVVITQKPRNVRQAPIQEETYWHILMNDQGQQFESSWENSLMGWQSSADPYHITLPLQFNNAAEAVYFAKKRGWHYVVKEPIKRHIRDDEAQYQDNFLSQALAAQVKEEGTACRHWERLKSGASHYFRPLKYHGDGTARQHGPNRDAEIAPAVESYYKRR